MKKEDPKIDSSGTYPQPSVKDTQEGIQEEFISVTPNDFEETADNHVPAKSRTEAKDDIENE